MKRVLVIFFAIFTLAFCMTAGGVFLYENLRLPEQSDVSEPSNEDNENENQSTSATANKFHLHFNGNGGTLSITAPYTCSHGMPELTYGAGDYNQMNDVTATRSGYIFNGWWTAASGGVLIYDHNNDNWCTNAYVSSLSSYIFSNNKCAYNGANGSIINLYAHWIKINVCLHYSANGGSVVEANQPYLCSHGMMQLTYNSDNYNKAGDIVVERSGYTFAGWWSAASGGVLIYDLNDGWARDVYVPEVGSYIFKRPNSSSVPICVYEGSSSVITIYAHWTAKSYTVSFVGNGATGTMTNRTWSYDTWYSVDNSFSWTGHTFAGWKIATGSTITHYYGASSTSYSTTKSSTFTDSTLGTRYYKNLRDTSGTVTFTAQWTINKYTITVKSSTGISSVSGGGTYSYGQSVTLSASVMDGYVFKNWNNSSSYTSASRTITVTSNATYTAYATPCTYTAVFDANGGSVSTSSKEVTYASSYGTLPTPTRDNYVFEGWYKKNNYIDMDAMMQYFNGFLSSSASTRVIKETNGTYSWEGQAGTMGAPDYTYRIFSVPLTNGATYRLSYTARSSENASDKTTSLAPRKKDNSDWYGNAYNDCYVINDTNWRNYETTFTVDATYGGFSFGNWWGATRTYFKNITLERIDVDDYEKQISTTTTFDTLGNQILYAKWTPVSIENKVYLRVISSDGNSVSAVGNSNNIGSVTVQRRQISGENLTEVTSVQTAASASYSVHKGQLFKLVASSKSGYVFAGFSTSSSPSDSIKNPTAPPSTIVSYYPTVGTSYYVYFKQVSGNVLKYDEVDKFFYFEDGYYPQSRATNESTLSLSATATGEMIRYNDGRNNVNIPVYSYSGERYVKVVKNGTSAWFKFEPIKWRISDYGVAKTERNIARYTSLCSLRKYTSYATNFVAVSDLILGVGAMHNSRDVGEGMLSYEMQGFENIQNITTSQINAKYFATSGNIIDVMRYGDSLNGEGNSTYNDSIVYSSPLRVASIKELESVGFVNKQAKASDMVAFILGLDKNQVSFWTRDLSNLGAGVAITPTGTTVRPWLDQMLGIRFVYTFREGSNIDFYS